MDQPDAIDWRAARELVALPQGKVNLNAGTLSPTPLPVLAAVNRLRGQMARNPSDFLWRQSGPLIERARRRLASYVNCGAAELLLLPNITFALNVVLNSLHLPPGSEILTTDHEYGAMMYAWRRVARRNGWSLRELPLPYRAEDPEEIVEAFREAIGSETRVLYFSHVTSTTGLVLPAKALCALARRGDLLCIVDGAHAPGMVPLNLTDLAADFYAANCHKWLMSPPTAGFLHLAPEHKGELQSLITSWGYEYDRADPEKPSVIQSTCWQFDHEFHGTADRCAQMVLPEAIDFRTEHLGGEATIAARVRELTNYGRERLGAEGLTCVTPRNEHFSAAMLAFEFPCDDPIAVRDRFYHEHDIECPVTVAAGRTLLRVSCAWFNTREEVDQLARAVKRIRDSARMQE